MQPIPYPADFVVPEFSRLVVVGPSDPTGSIRAVEALVSQYTVDEELVRRFDVLCVPDPGDVENLAAGYPLMLSFWGPIMVPFSITVTGPEITGEAGS